MKYFILLLVSVSLNAETIDVNLLQAPGPETTNRLNETLNTHALINKAYVLGPKKLIIIETNSPMQDSKLKEIISPIAGIVISIKRRP